MSQQQTGGGIAQSAAEWITLGVSVAVVLVMVGLIGYEYFSSGGQSPVIEARPQLGEVREVDSEYYLPIEVANRGEQTAEDVKVRVALTSDGAPQETSQFTINFLAGNDTEQEVVVFAEDPSQGELTTDLQGFRKP